MEELGSSARTRHWSMQVQPRARPADQCDQGNTTLRQAVTKSQRQDLTIRSRLRQISHLSCTVPQSVREGTIARERTWTQKRSRMKQTT